jgi:hypothetical protein
VTYLGYDRAEEGSRDMTPPLGGTPWTSDFEAGLIALQEKLTAEFRAELDKQSWYSTKHTQADDQFHAVQILRMAWNSATRHPSKESMGLFEVRLLSAVLTAARSIPLAMLAESKDETVSRPAGSFLNDLRVASQVLALYTGADAEDIQGYAVDQKKLMEYLSGRRPGS